MNQALDCPKCGAPLNFDPHPGQETVECPYCHEVVVIPKDLRVPLPKPPRPQPTRTANKQLNAVIIISAILSAVVFIVVAVLMNLPDKSSNSIPIDSNGKTAIALSPGDNATATIEAQATEQSLQSILAVEQGWPAGYTDNFTDNSNKWDTGDVRDDYITGNRTIANGVYTWNVTTVQSSIDYSVPDMPDQTDFLASVDMKLVKMPDDPDADGGLLLRFSSADPSWYYFSVNDLGQYYFGWYDGSNWTSLIPETDSSAINVGQVNRLGVAVQGSQFIFLINNQMIDHFIDENLQTGSIGLAINLPDQGEKATVEFSNFSVQYLSP